MLHRVRLFAVLRERAGSDTVEVEVPAGATVGEALRGLAEQQPALAPALAALTPVMAVNREYADAETVLAEGDELALIPPVSGGAAGAPPHARVVEEPLSAERLTALVATDHTGAVVTFQGTTRDVERLDYEAYAPMAEERIAAILADALAAHEIEGAAAEHRIGAVPRREPSVVVAVAAAHRGPAFAAAREVIDRIKAEAPIWKREVEGERAEWVEGTPPPTG
jgi:molybdopterin synthase catalytic subunit